MDENGGHSSVGRAVALQASGRRFDPVWLHHSYSVVFRHVAVETSDDSFAALQRAGVLLIDIVNEGICLRSLRWCRREMVLADVSRSA